MPTKGNRIPPVSPIDLKKVTESTRRALYDAIVATYFTPTPEERQRFAEDPDNHWIPTYGPDEAGLVVFYLCGRWIAIWRDLDAPPDFPEDKKWAVVRVGAERVDGGGGSSERGGSESGDEREGGGGVEFYEV